MLIEIINLLLHLYVWMKMLGLLKEMPEMDEFKDLMGPTTAAE